MFWENGNQPISVEFRGCFPHAEESEIMAEASRNKTKIPLF
jgi:hypothetical protein